MMKRILIGTITMLIAAGTILAETVTNDAVVATTNAAPVEVEETATNKWSFSASLATYIVNGSTDYLQPTITADRDWLHLEGRYNYEELDTASLWVGYNFSIGEKLTLEFTPMIGGVFGDADGVAPGYLLTLSYWKLELYSEGEYFIELDSTSENFFYNWSTLTLSPVEWFYAGMVTQRTRIDGEDRDIQRGPIIGFSHEWAELEVYCLDPTSDDWTLVFSVGVNF